MINYYYKLLYFLPLALVTGPFLPDLIVVICSLLFLIDTIKLKLFKYYNNYFFKIFLGFLILINLSSIFSEYYLPFKYSIGYIRYGIFSIFLFYVLTNFENFKINFSIIFFSVFILVILDGYIQYFFGKNIFFYELQKYNTGLPYVTSFFDEEKKLGSFLARLSPIFFISILMINNKINLKYQLPNSIIILLLFILILLTTERVSIFIITSLVILIFFKSRFLINSKKIFFVTFVILTIVVFYFNPSLFEKMKSVFYSIGIINPGQLSDGTIIGGYDKGLFIFSKYHHLQIITSFDIFKDNLFFGVGAKSYKFATLMGWHPHNIHLQTLAELGIFSYLILFSVFCLISFKLIKILFFQSFDNSYNEMNFYIVVVIFLNLLPIPSGDFFNNWLNIIYYFPIGFLLFLNEKKI